MISKSKQMINNISDFIIYYDETYSKMIKEARDQIKSKFEAYFKPYDIAISDRIKEKHSLYQKVFRKNKAYQFIEKSTIEDFKQLFKEDALCEDTLGFIVKTITYQELDDIANKYEDFCKVNKIKINNIGKQKKKMKNGLEYYNYKCVFLENDINIPFETQIKSNIISAWSNIEHELFYKNFTFYHEKSNNRKIMNYIGNLLLSGEDIISQVRDTYNGYKEDYNFKTFFYKITHTFGEKVKQELSTSIPIDDYIDFLFDKYQKIDLECKNIDKIGNNIWFEYMADEPYDFDKYSSFKSSKFLYGYMEFVYNNLVSDTIKPDIYVNMISDYMKYSCCKYCDLDEGVDDLEYISDDFASIFIDLINHKNENQLENSNTWTDSQSIFTLIFIIKYFSNKFMNFYDDNEMNVDESKIVSQVTSIALEIICFGDVQNVSVYDTIPNMDLEITDNSIKLSKEYNDLTRKLGSGQIDYLSCILTKFVDIYYRIRNEVLKDYE